MSPQFRPGFFIVTTPGARKVAQATENRQKRPTFKEITKLSSENSSPANIDCAAEQHEREVQYFKRH
jgi:hypothetical protein